MWTWETGLRRQKLGNLLVQFNTHNEVKRFEENIRLSGYANDGYPRTDLTEMFSEEAQL